MDREQVIKIAKQLGWNVRDLNDNEHGYMVRGANYQIYNDFMSSDGQSFWSEDAAWDFIVGRIRGGVLPDASGAETKVTGQRGAQLKEIMEFRHPSVDKLKSARGNVYALAQRKQGKSPSFYTMSVGIEVAGQVPVSGLYIPEYKTFHADCNGFDAVSQEAAMQQIYDQFTAWKIEHVDKTGS